MTARSVASMADGPQAASRPFIRSTAKPWMMLHAARLATIASDEAIVMLNVTSQAVTPMTERTTRYFFSTGPLRRLGSEEQRDAFVATTYLAFNEDKVVIEAQQRIIDLTPNPLVMPTVHDRAVTMFNRLIKKMLDEEAAGAVQHVA